MKNILFASAAAAALFAAAPALAQSTGSVGAGFSHSEIELGGLDADADIWTVDGNVAFQASPAWTVTLDGAVAYDDDAASDEFSVAGTAHLTRDLGDARVGGFAGLADAGGETAWAAGLEGAKYLDRVTLVGQVAYGEVDDTDLTVDTFNVGLRYSFGGDLRARDRSGADLGGIDSLFSVF